MPQDSSFLSGSLSDYARSCGVDESLFKAILHDLDFSRAQYDKDMRDFSAGQKKKVLLARSLCEPAHLHVWDEPLNYVDVISREQIEELLHIPAVGVIPYMRLDVDDEDSLSERLHNKAADLVDIAVIRVPRLSNFTDRIIQLQKYFFRNM